MDLGLSGNGTIDRSKLNLGYPVAARIKAVYMN